jgi:hypothetical protein
MPARLRALFNRELAAETLVLTGLGPGTAREWVQASCSTLATPPGTIEPTRKCARRLGYRRPNEFPRACGIALVLGPDTADAGIMVVPVEPQQRGRMAVPLRERHGELEGRRGERGRIIFSDGQENGNLSAGHMRQRRTAREDRLVLSEILRHIRTHLALSQNVEAARQDGCRHQFMPAHIRIEQIGGDMRCASRVAEHRQARRIAAEPRDMGLHPADGALDVARRRRPCELGREPVIERWSSTSSRGLSSRAIASS